MWVIPHKVKGKGKIKLSLHQEAIALFSPISKYIGSLSGILFLALSLIGETKEVKSAQTPLNPEIKVGVVQRFGSVATDKLTLKATEGDRLTLKFKTPKGDETLTVNSVKLEIGMQPLTEAQLDEKIIFSSHRSFESAEESANQWKAKGIEVEIAQPDRWQVWARRDVYNTPLLRRLLLENLKSQGNNAYLDTKVIKQKPQAFFVVNGFRYNRNELEITAKNRLIEVIPENKNNKESSIYGGSLQLQTNAYGTYTLVNKVPIETYLRGVVPFEIGASAPYASQESQAILARTYALRNLRRFVIDNYEMCADVNCQVYKGIKETYAQTDRAISSTKGMVLTYENELVDALYSAASGGVTASFQDVWQGAERPYLKSVIDAPTNLWNLSQNSLADETNFRKFMSLKQGFNEEGEKVFRWREFTTLGEMTQFLKRYLTKKQSPLVNSFTQIKKVDIVKRSPSGRVLNMKIETDRAVINIDKDEIRNAFEPPISTLFYLEPVYNPDRTIQGYTFIGGGFGHGVGMSQRGSYNLAKLGWERDRILQFYFPGAMIQPLTEKIIFWREPQSRKQ